MGVEGKVFEKGIDMSAQEVLSRKKVWHMFDRIATRYDLLNRLLSFGQDIRWRNKLARMLPDRERLKVLDVATGTGDVILSLFEKNRNVFQAVGVDMSEKMLEIGRRKMRENHLDNVVELQLGDAAQLPFEDAQFDAVTIAFGIRNVYDVDKALQEMHRVLKPGGRALILEFSLPTQSMVRSAYLLYFRHVLPKIGGIISGDPYAYQYLNKTVESFPYGEAFCAIMEANGFNNVKAKPLTLGVATIYQGDKA